MSLQEQAKAIAEPLEHLENSIEFLARFRRYFEDEDAAFDEEDSDNGSTDTSDTVIRTDHDYLGAPTEVIVSSQIDGNNNNDNAFSSLGSKSQRQERRSREKERRVQASKRRRRSADLRRFDNMRVDLRKARKTLDDRLVVIDIAHQHNWDVARRYVEKEKPIRNKNLKEAIEESKKEADSKKDKAEKNRRKRFRYSRRSSSPSRKRSRSPRERRRSPDRFHSRYGRKKFGYDKDKAGCFTCGSASHRARECPDKRSK